MPVVNVHAAKTQLSRLIERAVGGEDIVIARRSKPVVRLVPVERATPKREFGALKKRLVVPAAFFEPLPEQELKEWEG